MLMSMFSSFDALHAESLRQKVALSWASSSGKDMQSQGACKKIDEVKKGKEVNGNSEAKKSEDHMPPRRPSSFEALCAESFGQKVALSPPPCSDEEVKNQEASKKIDEAKKGKVNDSSPAKKLEDLRPSRRPRFAPELDGLHCFETIIRS